MQDSKTKDTMDRIKSGNNSYLAGQFKDALESYQLAENQSAKSYGLFFNMGNSHYRLKNFPEALKYYRMAEDIRPRDVDLKSNIELLKKLATNGAQSTIPEQWQNYLPLIGIFSKSELLASANFSFAALVVAFMLKRLSSNFRLPKFLNKISGSISGFYIFVIFSLSAYCYLLIFAKWHNEEPGSRGIVQAQQTSARSDASDQSLELFKLSQLTEVKVLQEGITASGEHDWIKIKANANNTGWVPKKDLVVY